MSLKPKLAVLVTAIFAAQVGGALTEVAAQPSAATVRTYDGYLGKAESQMEVDYRPGGAFISRRLLSSADTGGELKTGRVVAACVAGCDSSGIRIPAGLIHDWVGAVFIPGSSLQQVLALVQDYDHSAEHYAPNVTESRLLARDRDDYRVFLQLRQTEFITVLFNTEYDVRYVRLDSSRAYSISHATKIAQIAHGSKDRELPPGQNDGFLWRLDAYWRFEQVPSGVYVQCRAISLSRAIPRGLSWLVTPFIKNVPRKSLEFTLSATRSAVLEDLRSIVPSGGQPNGVRKENRQWRSEHFGLDARLPLPPLHRRARHQPTHQRRFVMRSASRRALHRE